MKKLVAYFSASGVTAKRAGELAAVSGAELFEIRPKTAYTAADLDWTDPRSRSSREMKEDTRPELADSIDLAPYDVIYLGFPIWWGVAPKAVNSFIEANNFEGKRIVVFATSGGSGERAAIRDLERRYPSLSFEDGGLLSSRVAKDII